MLAAECYLAEREGFQPPPPVKVWPLSRRLVSTTHAPLRAVKFVVSAILAGATHSTRPVIGLELSPQAAARPTCALSRWPGEHTERSWRKIFSGLERSDSKKQKRRRFRRRSCKNTASKPI